MSYAEGGNVLGGSVRGRRCPGGRCPGGDVLHPFVVDNSGLSAVIGCALLAAVFYIFL